MNPSVQDIYSCSSLQSILILSVLPALQVPMLGRFRYMGKPDKQHTAPVKCIIHMFVMHVADELQVWPEMAQRQRFWVSMHHLMRHWKVSLKPHTAPTLCHCCCCTLAGTFAAADRRF